jgi:hypothetical protein
MKKILTGAIALTCLLCSCSKKEIPMKSTATTPANVTYTESTEDIVNPERGFYQYAEIHASNYYPLDQATLAAYRTVHPITNAKYTVASSLVFLEYVMDSFKNTPLSADFLTKLNTDCATARAAGIKLIPRFVYVNITHAGGCSEGSICPPYGDAPKAIVLGHIAQLKPYFQLNEDVIACVQLGLIGIYGENYYTDYFGDASSNAQGKLLDANWSDRNEVIKAMLSAIPTDRMLQVRYPQIKERYVYGVSANVISPATTEEEAFTGIDKARIGLHNDCFLSGPNDVGTYVDYGNSATPLQDATSVLRNFESYDSKYTVVGGETCDNSYSPQNDCGPTGMAQTEFAIFHYSFLNSEYNLSVNNDWVTGGCMEEIKSKLGYRLVLKSGSFPAQASAGGQLEVAINLQNQGYASPFNPRRVQLLLRNQSGGKVTVMPFNTEIRKWYTGDVVLTEKLALPGDLAAGTYDLLLNLPDKFATLSTRPEYSIRMANANTWEPTTGYNKLNASLIIK